VPQLARGPSRGLRALWRAVWQKQGLFPAIPCHGASPFGPFGGPPGNGKGGCGSAPRPRRLPLLRSISSACCSVAGVLATEGAFRGRPRCGGGGTGPFTCPRNSSVETPSASARAVTTGQAGSCLPASSLVIVCRRRGRRRGNTPQGRRATPGTAPPWRFPCRRHLVSGRFSPCPGAPGRAAIMAGRRGQGNPFARPECQSQGRPPARWRRWRCVRQAWERRTRCRKHPRNLSLGPCG
jgi:hypothetical protein